MQDFNELLTRIEKCISIQRPEFFQQKYIPVLGLSGGADSVFVLDYLNEIYQKNLIRQPVLFHLNHLLRKDEAGNDENFCRQLAEKYNFPLLVCHLKSNRIKKLTLPVIIRFLNSLKKKY